MCGIFCTLSATHHILPDATLEHLLHNRGPDSRQTIRTEHVRTTCQKDDTSTSDIHITFHSTVLSLRGSRTVSQPYKDLDGNFTLCWNGEAWTIGDRPPLVGNDTEAVHRLLANTLKSSFNQSGVELEEPLASAAKIAEALSQVAGPYAFVFLDHARGRLFVGRDFFGRRSLLTRITSGGDLTISSVSDGVAGNDWMEIEADGVYCVDLHKMDAVAIWPDPQYRRWGRFNAALAPYAFAEDAVTDTKTSFSVIPRLSLNRELPITYEPLSKKASAVAHLEMLLKYSLSLRVLNIPDPPSHDTNQSPIGRAKLAVLFSGGLDCTVLARMSHDLLPATEPIDLLNVAFENPRIHKQTATDANSNECNAYEQCPDRMTGRASYAELQRTCSTRTWRFVAINIPYSETTKYRQQMISLMHPHNTEMDLSIAFALYFAARGLGEITTEASADISTPTSYTTSARVLLSGLGADELFAGYTRHATAFKRTGLEGLLDELELDVARLGKRNLGRDDRVMAHWSKEVRLPYLDEKVVAWALRAPVTAKCGFRPAEARGLTSNNADSESESLEPEKKVLRCLARKLGMNGAAKEKKRAIQFGARTAKMETGKKKGTQFLSP